MPVIDNSENMDKCICGSCPTYNDCMKQEHQMLFCAKGKAGCEFEKRGCICMSCPIHRENRLTSGYYCENGAAA